MRAWILCGLLVAFTLPAASTAAAADFLVFPVQTPLERILISTHAGGVGAAVFLNGSVLAAAKGWDSSSLAAALEQCRRAGAEGAVYVEVLFGAGGRPPDQLDATLEAVCKKAGFGRAIVARSYSAAKDPFAAKLAVPDRDLQAGDEQVADADARFTIYVVATTLARLLTGGCDCVVDLRAAVEESSAWFLDPDLRQAIRQQLDEVELGQRGAIDFQIHRLLCGDQGMQRLQIELQKIAVDLGFKGAGFSVHSQEDIRYKGLLGKPPPDLVLEGLSSKQPESLADLIAGKVAVLTFWGFG